jgi:hypothetical protein
MNTTMSDDELTAAVRGIAVTDPLPGIDHTQLVARGSRGLRRRRLLAGATAAVAVTAVAVSAALLPDLDRSASVPPVAGTPSTAASGEAFEPLPGVPAGEAALQRIGATEAQRRCDLRYPGRKLDPVYSDERDRGGERLPFVLVAGDEPTGCVVPGGARPAAATIAAAKADPVPTDPAAILRNCSVLFWHDLTHWRLIAQDTAPGLVTIAVMLSPSGRLVATCQLPASAASDSRGGADHRWDEREGSIHPVVKSREVLVSGLEYGGGRRSVCPAFGQWCAGALFYGTNEVPEDIVRITFRQGRASHVVAASHGWFALAWQDEDLTLSHGTKVTAYDARGKVVYHN